MRVAIITGGETGEREISIKSAANISELIDFAQVTTFTFPEDKERFLESANTFTLAIPMIHGMGGEDGTLQIFLEELHLPFLFSNKETHQVGIDKQKTKAVVAELGIMSPKVTNEFPLFAKPRFGGSSVATRLCNSPEELTELKDANPNLELLTEEPIKGREFTVGVVEYNGTTMALPVVEIIPKGAFFDFENKYNPEKLALEICPAEIPEILSKELQSQSLKIHTYLRARHLSRCDFIVTPENRIYFLEINTIPGMTDTSLIPKMLTCANLSLKALLKEWCLSI